MNALDFFEIVVDFVKKQKWKKNRCWFVVDFIILVNHHGERKTHKLKNKG
jgi:hypothetical protein